MKKGFISSNYGFTFPELSMSILILATVLVLIIGMFTGGVVGLKKGDNLIIATNMAQSTLDLYSQNLLASFDSYSADTYHLSDQVLDNLTFEKWVTFQNDRGTKATNRVKTILVTIYWFEKKGVETKIEKKKMQFITCINNYND